MLRKLRMLFAVTVGGRFSSPDSFSGCAPGSCAWVITMTFVGYAFANEFESLLGCIEKGSWAIAAGLFPLGYLIWRGEKHNYEERQRGKAA